MTARDEIAKVLTEHDWASAMPEYAHHNLTVRHDAHIYDALCAICRGDTLTIADALLASPTFADLIREAKREGRAEGWDEGRAYGYIEGQNYYVHSAGCGPDEWDCDCPNPHRTKESD